MDLFANLATGFAVALTPANIGFCFLGALIGTLVGVLPGIAPITTIAILLPFTFSLPPASSLIMLAGIFYGAQYGGSTTAILVNVPGESSAIVTCIDGHQMAKQGRAGPALTIAAIASFVAGTIATIVLATASAPMSWLALKFNAAEYFSLMVLGLTGAVVLAAGSPEKAVAMVLVGLLLGLVGIDVNTGAPRMTMELAGLGDGIGFVPVAIGLFGIAELAVTLGRPQERHLLSVKFRDLWPSWAEMRACTPAMLRGTALGSVLGVLPGGGAALSSFAAYAVEKKMSQVAGALRPRRDRGRCRAGGGQQRWRTDQLHPAAHARHPRQRHHGADGRRHDDPGHPARPAGDDRAAAIVLGRDRLDVARQPDADRAQPAADRVWVSLLRVPYRLMFPMIVLFCCIGTYSVGNTVFDIWVMLLFGVLGVFFYKVGAEPAPFILGFILGPLMEENFRRAMYLSRGDPMVFLERPISAILLAMSLALLVLLVLPEVKRKREEVFRRSEAWIRIRPPRRRGTPARP